MYKTLEKADWTVLSELALEIAGIIIDDIKDGKDEGSEPSFEQVSLYSKMAEQLEFMEEKYGPHPLILDTKADIIKDPEEKIQLKEKAKSLCLSDDFDLRGVLCTELAELYFEEKNDIVMARKQIQEAKQDFEKTGNKKGLKELRQVEEEIEGAA
ncbi:MAG: hypothetical protein JWO30_4469 [Fibrobacteres bacterium]|nr:hypothetical protein [Fibrobacterota bacterium]